MLLLVTETDAASAEMLLSHRVTRRHCAGDSCPCCWIVVGVQEKGSRIFSPDQTQLTLVEQLSKCLPLVRSDCRSWGSGVFVNVLCSKNFIFQKLFHYIQNSGSSERRQQQKHVKWQQPDRGQVAEMGSLQQPDLLTPVTLTLQCEHLAAFPIVSMLPALPT